MAGPVGELEDEARELMLAFADRTGLTSDAPPDRYLWTDAFAVCNFLALDRTDLASQLVDQVHRVLGRHRPDDPRDGWISGLEGPEAEAHPTAGGLRIGKPLPEREPTEPIDERIEWDRDGQYFHYLTKWMHALERVSRSTGDATYRRWARELAEAAHGGFVRSGPHAQMAWKMSIDLSRPLVAPMGHHDPLDGYVTCLRLAEDDATALSDARGDFAAMIPSRLATIDPLGIGGLLTDAWHLDQLGAADLRDRVLDDAAAGLEAWAQTGELDQPAESRLAFRELGLAIGLAAIDGMEVVRPSFATLVNLAPMRERIEAFWREPSHRQVGTWREHRNINDVMLATALVPWGYLG